MQRLVSTQRRRSRSTSRSIAAACACTIKATPALTEMKDNFGNVHRIGVLGITGARERRCRSIR